MEKPKGMPILGNRDMAPFPWNLLEPHREQALINHGQTLEELAKRGGLSPKQMVAVLEDTRTVSMTDVEAIVRLAEIMEGETRKLRARVGSVVELKTQFDSLRERVSRENEFICQTLGQVLGYPWFVDDQVNFPGATKEQGVCVGDHVAASLAMEAARKIGELRGKWNKVCDVMPPSGRLVLLWAITDESMRNYKIGTGYWSDHHKMWCWEGAWVDKPWHVLPTKWRILPDVPDQNEH